MEALTDRLMSWHAATSTRPGERDSGDRCVVVSSEAGLLVAVIDGLGHGPDALASAEVAAETLQGHAGESVITLVRRCHEQLRRGRGVVMSLASFDPLDKTMTWLGVGNVDGRLQRADPDVVPRCEFLLLRAGVIGHQLPPLHASLIPLSAGDTLLFATDGVVIPPAHELPADEPPQVTAERLLARYRKEDDDALILVGRWAGG